MKELNSHERSTDNLLECSFLVPIVRDSDRRLHQPILWQLLEDELRALCTGWQGPERRIVFFVNSSLVPGAWTDESDRLVRHESRKYTVAVPTSRLADLKSLLFRVGNSFDQRSVYLRIGETVEFLEPEPHHGHL